MNVAAPQARNLYSLRSPFDSKLREEWHIPDVTPTELGVFCGRTFYKDVAPLVLGKAAVNAPALQTLREVRRRPEVAKRLECA